MKEIKEEQAIQKTKIMSQKNRTNESNDKSTVNKFLSYRKQNALKNYSYLIN